MRLYLEATSDKSQLFVVQKKYIFGAYIFFSVLGRVSPSSCGERIDVVIQVEGPTALPHHRTADGFCYKLFQGGNSIDIPEVADGWKEKLFIFFQFAIT